MSGILIKIRIIKHRHLNIFVIFSGLLSSVRKQGLK